MRFTAEDFAFLQTLVSASGDTKAAAANLRINRSTLRRIMLGMSVRQCTYEVVIARLAEIRAELAAEVTT